MSNSNGTSRRTIDHEDGYRIRLSDLAVINPPPPPISLAVDASVSFIPMSDVDENGKWRVRQQRPLSQVWTGYTAFREGDVLFAKITPCTQNGKGCHAVDLANGLGFGSTEFHVLRARDGVNPRLLYHLSQDRWVRLRAVSTMGGSAGQQRVPNDYFDIFRVPAGILRRQEEKAALFDAVDEAIERTRAVIFQTRRLKTALLQDLLAHGLPGRHAEFVEHKQIGFVPTSWRVIPLKEAVSYWQYGLSDRLEDRGMYRCLRMNNYAEGRITAEDVKFANLTEKEFTHYRLERGDILFNRTNSRELVGKVGIFDLAGDCVFASYLVRMRADRDIVRPEFLNLLLNTIENQTRIRRLATPGVSQSNINAENLKRLRVALPNIEEQDDILALLTGVRRSLESKSARLTQLTITKTALSQALLTGRVRIPEVMRS